jgi:hypothetical protein
VLYYSATSETKRVAMNPQTEPSEPSEEPNTTSSNPAPASGHSEPNTTVAVEKPQDGWSSASSFCNSAGSFLDPVSLLFGEGGGEDDDEMPGETLLADDEESETSASLTLTGDDMGPVIATVEEIISPGYQKRGRFLVWPTSLGGPMGFPLGLHTR